MYESWETLKNECIKCTKCALCKGRTNVVFGEGNPNIYIGNIVKCRPPHNRDPLPEEQELCINWLRNQVLLLKPKIIVAVGRIAAMKIIDPNIKITKQHGIFYLKKKTWMMPTIHPAAILRNPNQKPLVEQDFINLKEKIKEICVNTY